MLYVPWVAEVSLAEILLLQFFKSLLASFSVSAFVQSKLQGSGKLLNERRSNICYTSEPQYIQMLLLYDRYTCLTTFSKQKLSQFIFLLLLVSSLESIFSVFLCLSETEFFIFFLHFVHQAESVGHNFSLIFSWFHHPSVTVVARMHIYISILLLI